MEDFRLGQEIRHLGQALKTRFVEVYSQKLPNGLAGYEGWVIGYLFKHQDEEITPNHLTKAFKISKSTASEMLSKLSNARFIKIEKSHRDKRRNTISLTKKGMQHQLDARKVFDEFEKEIKSGLSEEELEQFKTLIEKVIGNIGGKK